MGRRCATGDEGSEGDRREHRRGRLCGPRAALLLLHDLQIRHRRLHRAEAHLRRPGLDDVQALRHRQGLAGQHGAVESYGRLAAAEGFRSAPRVVGGEGGPGAAARDRAYHLAAVRGRAGDSAGVDHQSVGCGYRHAAGDVPDRVPRQSEDHHAHRSEAAVRLRRLVADLALSQQRGEAVRRQGRALGVVPLHRPAATDRCRLSRCLAGVVAAAAALPAAGTVLRCGEGPAGKIRHAGIRSEEG